VNIIVRMEYRLVHVRILFQSEINFVAATRNGSVSDGYQSNETALTRP